MSETEAKHVLAMFPGRLGSFYAVLEYISDDWHMLPERPAYSFCELQWTRKCWAESGAAQHVCQKLHTLILTLFPDDFHLTHFIFILPLTAYTPQQNLSGNMKITMWLHSVSQVNDYDEYKHKTAYFPSPLHD